MRAPWARIVVGLVVLAGMGCGREAENPVAPPAPAASSTSADDEVAASATARMTWSFQDGCPDGRGLRVRVFDFTDDTTQFPTKGVWLVGSGRTISKTIECTANHRMCYGAVTNPVTPGYYWGAGINRQYAPSICRPCRNNRRVSLRLICPNLLVDQGGFPEVEIEE